MELLVKSHIPIFVLVGVVLVGLAVCALITPSLESPQDRLDRQIDEKVAAAQRLLSHYQPISVQLSRHLGSAATQPVDVPSAEWQEMTRAVEQDSAISDALRAQTGQINKLESEYQRLDGEPARRPAIGSSVEAYSRLQSDLAANDRKLADALQIMQEAIRMNEGEFRGSDHPAATRLETILCYHQANLLRRKAALTWERMEDSEAHLDRYVDRWNTLAVRIELLEQELNGGALPSQVVEDQATASEPAATAPAEMEPAETAPADTGAVVEDTTGAADEKAAPSEAPKTGRIGSLLKRLVKSKADSDTSDDTVADASADETAEEAEETVADTGPMVRRILPAMRDRITALEGRKAETERGIAAARDEATRLTAAVADIEAKIAAAEQRAATAEQEMFRLQEAGIDSSDPKSLERFVAHYEKAAEAYRLASREAIVLKEGAIRNAKVDAPDVDDVATGPLVASDPAKEMAAERGLIALQSDLRAAEGLVETRETLLAEITRQIKELSARQVEATNDLAVLGELRSDTTGQAALAAKAAIAAAFAADQFEADAIEMADTRGRQAAQRAQQAIQKRMRDAASLDREAGPETPNPRLVMMAGDNALAGHTATLAGDLAFEAARTHAQHAEGLARYRTILAKITRIGLEVGEAMLPEGATADTAPAWLANVEDTDTAIAEARTAAIEAAEQALEIYNEADGPLKQLWVLRANIGAVHLLLANLTSGEEAENHLTEARVEYGRALQSREDRPEAPIYQGVVAEIEAAATKE